MDLDVGFTCKASITGGVLEVTYTIDNRTAGELGAFNRIKSVRIDGTLDWSPDNVYVDLEGDTLNLRKMALPIPPNLSISAYTPPKCSRIPAGATFTETVRAAIPVRVCHPFKRALLHGTVVPDAPAKAKKAAFHLGVFPAGDGVRLVAENPAFPDVMTAVPPDPALAGQQVVTSEFLLDPPLDVLDYRVVPW